jgi:phage virion morphogenesis protein
MQKNATFDFSELSEWLNNIANKEKSEEFKEVVGKTILETIALNFDLSKNPYGENWQPLKYRKGQILKDTGLLAKSITYSVQNDAVYFGTNRPYAPIHQYGYALKNVPQRSFLPTAQGGLPQEWKDDILRVFKYVFFDKKA